MQCKIKTLFWLKNWETAIKLKYISELGKCRSKTYVELGKENLKEKTKNLKVFLIRHINLITLAM